jgi:protein-disulfide isomerase
MRRALPAPLLAAPLLAALLLLSMTLLPPPAKAADAPASFSPAQRGEIVEIVRQALKTDPSILRDAVTALQSEEAAIKEAAARAALDSVGPGLTRGAGDPVAGDPNGDVTVVEFYDLRCPYCRRMVPIVAELLHGDPKLRWVYKDIPILGPGSVLGAKAVLAAQKQGGYVRLHDAVMVGAPNITEDSLHSAATRVGLDWERLQRDMADPGIQQRIDTNLEIARRLGVDGTPAYVIGGKMLPGAVDLAELRAAVAAARIR